MFVGKIMDSFEVRASENMSLEECLKKVKG